MGRLILEMENKKQMNLRIFIIALAVVLALTANCKKDEKKDNTPTLGLLALAYASDLQSGNCATVTKTGTSYSASITPIPKGACTVATTREAAVLKFKAFYAKMIDVYTKAGSACDSTKTTIQSQSDALTVNSNLGPGSNSTEDQYATYIAKQKAFVVGNLVSEGAITLSTAGYTVANTTSGSVDQYFLAQSNLYANGSSACQTAVKALDSVYFAEVTAKTKVNLINDNSCKYGTGSDSTNRCASLSEQY
jgi:hypothetical protein